MSEWLKARSEISHRFAGQIPYDEEDDHVVQGAWERNPEAVEREVERLASEQAQGKIRFPWRILAKTSLAIRASGSKPARGSSSDRAGAVQNFDTWLRHSGLHYDRWSEVEDEVFGERGTLRHWQDDETLQLYVKHSWEEHRHAGVELERAMEERMARYRLQQEPVPPEPR